MTAHDLQLLVLLLSPGMLLSVLLYLIPTAVLLRKKKLPEVQLYWHQYVKK